MNNKIKFLIVLFYNLYVTTATSPFFISLILCTLIYLLPKLNYTIYLLLIIILNVLNYLFITTLYKKVKKYLKLLNFNFLEFNLYYFLILNILLFASIIEKILNIHELSFPFLLPPQIFYSILFFISLYIIYKEMKLSELENYDELLSKFLSKSNLIFSKTYPYHLYIILYFFSLTYKDYSFLFYLINFSINPAVVTLCVISLIEDTTYYVRKAFLELNKLRDKII